MFLGFLGSGHRVKDRDIRRQVSARRAQIARTAFSLGLLVVVVVLALDGMFFWLDTGKWPGMELLELGQRLFSARAGPEPLSQLQQFLWWLLAKVPVSLILLAIGAWIAWKVFPRAHGGAPPPGIRTIDEIRTAVRAIAANSLVIVSRQRPRLFEYLKAEYQRNPMVHVILDRRWGNNRHRHEDRDPERRRGDRRQRPDPGGAALAADVIVTPQKSKARAAAEQSNESREDNK